MLLFDIGANRGDATLVGLNKGYKVIALEPAPRVYAELVKNFIYNKNVVPLKFAVSDSNDETIEFYEAEEDGLSTINKDWLTADNMLYKGRSFRTITASTITVDRLVELYGTPDLIKIDVEGAEWSVFRGMTKKSGRIAFEWTECTLPMHDEQLMYLRGLGYTEFALQFITHHLEEPHEDDYYPIEPDSLSLQIELSKEWWENEGWKEAGIRRTADVGMVWVK